MATKLKQKLFPRWFTPADQKEDPKPTRYRIQPMSEVLKAEIELIIGEGGLGQFKAMRYAVFNSVTDWENVSGDDGPEEFSVNELECIPKEHIQELFTELMFNSELSETERKNSSSQLPSEPTPPDDTTAPDATQNTAQQNQTQPGQTQ